MESEGSTSTGQKKSWLFWGLALLLLALIFRRTLGWLLLTWRGSPYYGHGFLIPPVAGFLAWRVWRRHRARIIAPSIGELVAGTLVTALAIVGHYAALSRARYSLSSCALVMALAGLVLSEAGGRMLWRQVFPLGFLLFMIPVPWLESMAPALARCVTDTVAYLAQLLQLGVRAEGARLVLPNLELSVGAPCSGVNSLVALSSLGTLYAFLVSGPVLGRVGLALLSPFVALFSNLLRVGILLVLARYVGERAALSYFHDWSSPVLLTLGLASLIVLGKVLGCEGLRSDI
jgi:exosortase